MSQKQTPAQQPTRVEEFTTHLIQTVYTLAPPAYLSAATAYAAQGPGDEAKPRVY